MSGRQDHRQLTPEDVAVVKFSGAALGINGVGLNLEKYLSESPRGNINFDAGMIDSVCDQILSVWQAVLLFVVIGGGNLFRGSHLKVDPKRPGKTIGVGDQVSDYVGMMGSIINAVILADKLKQKLTEQGEDAGNIVRVLAPFKVPGVGVYHSMDQLASFDDDKRNQRRCIYIEGGGTGMQGWSTDTAFVTFANQLNAAVGIKVTDTDLFDSDPKANPGARRIPYINNKLYVQMELGILDTHCVALAKTPIGILNGTDKDNLSAFIGGGNVGSRIDSVGPMKLWD